MKPTFEEIKKIFPEAEKAADGFILKDGDFRFHVFDTYRKEAHEGLTQEEGFYIAFCSKDEIFKLREIKTPQDYLLWLRAEAIVDSARLVRVFRKRAKKVMNWSLTKYYETKHKLHQRYISEVSKNYQNKIEKLTAGMAFIDEVNAMCINTDFGNVVVVSETLSYFLYYMNIAFLGEQFKISSKDTSAALAIAIRIMLGHESLDFDIDSRGKLPRHIEEAITKYTNHQLYFTFGHEYAHHTLGHLSKSNVITTKLCNISASCKDEYVIRHYKYTYSKEYDADWFAIKNIKGNKSFRCSLADAAFLLFIYFDILDCVYRFMSLRNGVSQTHPAPLDRLWKLRKRLNKRIGSPPEIIKDNVEYANHLKKILTSDWLPYHIEELEIYGSYYLPSYKKKMLIDRKEF